MGELVDLRTNNSKLVGRLEPETMRLHVVFRGESAIFDLPALAGQCGVLVRICADVRESSIPNIPNEDLHS